MLKLEWGQHGLLTLALAIFGNSRQLLKFCKITHLADANSGEQNKKGLHMGEADGFIASARAKLEREILNIEKRDDLTDDQKVSQIIVVFSSICAGVAIQPIPFADVFILTPIQAYMGTRISAIRGMPLSEKEVGEVLKEIAGVVGLGLLAQQLAIGAYKTVLPFLAGFTTIPLVFGMSFGIGKVMDTYFVSRAKGERMSPDQIKKAWAQARAEGNKKGKEKANEIKKDAKRQ